jgi:hypothetical protein
MSSDAVRRGSPPAVGFSRPGSSVPRDPANAARVWCRISLGLAVSGLIASAFLSPPEGAVAARSEGPQRLAAERELESALSMLRWAVAAYRRDHGRWPGEPQAAPEPWVGRCSGEWSPSRLPYRSGPVTPPNGAWIAESIDAYLGPGLPRNAINGLADLDVVGPREPMPASADGGSGWIYDPVSGELRANTPGRMQHTGRRFYDL